MATTFPDGWIGFHGTGRRETIDVGGFVNANIEPLADGPKLLSSERFPR